MRVRCTGVERAASEFDHQLQGDVQRVTERYRKCQETIETVKREREEFIASLDQMENDIRDKVETVYPTCNVSCRPCHPMLRCHVTQRAGIAYSACT